MLNLELLKNITTGTSNAKSSPNKILPHSFTEGQTHE